MQRTRVVPKIHGVWPCPNKNHFLRFGAIKIVAHDDGSEYVDIPNATLDTDINSISKVLIRIHRCIGTVSETTCEYFNSFTWTTALCQLIKIKGVFWTPLKESIHPKAECPIKQGHYEVINGSTNYDQMGDILGSGLEKFVWRGDLEIFNERGDLAACSLIHSEFRRILAKHR
ncbi:uncharacterized protein LOC117652832 [Thrips palmi]|uniref:Uncharacterized protein LOC117652832 n=1 Tax=Thrips palmi TaxID=161013 RepID=A0A6P9A9B3_THRPL|nr:uncharacterized protein LOC117652832 [Thrips palmi]